VKARELVKNPKNWRRHPKTQTDALVGLLHDIGYADALIVRELPDGRLMLIDGHLRADITPDMRVPVLVLNVDEAEADKLLATLDPLAALAETDVEKLRGLLATVTSDDTAVCELLATVAGQADDKFEPHALLDPDAGIDRAAELRKKWNTKKHQLWKAKWIRLLCADSRDLQQIRRLFAEGAKFRTLWADAPYGVNYAAKNTYLNATDRGNRIQKPIVNDALNADGIRNLFESTLRTALNFSASGATCYTTVPSGPLLPYFIAGFENSGFSFKHLLIWIKQHFVIGLADYQPRHEAILYGWVENGRHYFVKNRTRDSVFEIDRPHVSDLHPTTKPVELVGAMILNSSRPGEVVYDPFCGSGTTLVAAHQLGRRGYGVEIDPDYVAVTLERLSQLGLKPELIEDSRD
jgi:DNA modification methylase